MNVQKQIDALITQRAAEWLETLKSGRAEHYPQFVSWIGESPRHMSEFLGLLAMSRELPGAFARAEIDRDALLERLTSNVRELQKRNVVLPRSNGMAGKPKRWIAAAAALIVGVGAFLWIGMSRQGQNFSTDIGEQRTVTLADGSVMYLNAHSTARVKFEAGSRDIQLVRGEALFQVARDRQRPFRVHTRDAVVRAIGTRFNVDARQTRTIVSVLEGKVEVSTDAGPASASAEPLSAGEAAEVSREGKLERHSTSNVAGEAAWRQRQLVFSKTSLEDVAADFNRFHRNGRMVLKGVEPSSHHYTGTFDADDVASFALLLSREKDLIVEKQGGDYVVRPRVQEASAQNQ